VFVLAAIAGPPIFVLAVERLFGQSPQLGAQVLIQLGYCGFAAGLIITALLVERLPFASIGIRRPSVSTWVLVTMIFLVAQFVLPLLTTPLLRALGDEGMREGLQRLAVLPMWFRLMLAVTGGTIEETLYRGYTIERLAVLTGHRWLAGLTAAVVFGLAHVPFWGGAFAIAVDLPFGILMTAVYLWRRDLIANILAHCASLVVGLLAF
jgi:membrane protease YdiL (CAAX protease family)